jgi:hypothetical protein
LTLKENKVFKEALAAINPDVPNRWEMVVLMLPRKTVAGVVDHCRALENDVGVIEAGLVPFPHYESSSTLPGFTLDWDGGGNGFRRSRVLPQAWVRPPGAEEGHPLDGGGAQVIWRIGSESIIFVLLQLLAKFDRVPDHANAGGS